MFHLFTGSISSFGGKKYISNECFGIEIFYLGTKTQATLFLYPHIDDNKKTIVYYAFDTVEQKNLFEQMLKISGIGGKTAFQIVQLPEQDIKNAITGLDVKFFQNIPGIGPKTAKKILLELKDSFSAEDLTKLAVDEKLYKNIVKSLNGFGYESSKIKEVLQQYEGKITKENMGEVIKWVIGHM